MSDNDAEDANEIVVVVKENKGQSGKKNKEDELGRVKIALEELEGKREVDRWFSVSKNGKPTGAILHLRFIYDFSKVQRLYTTYTFCVVVK